MNPKGSQLVNQRKKEMATKPTTVKRQRKSNSQKKANKTKKTLRRRRRVKRVFLFFVFLGFLIFLLSKIPLGSISITGNEHESKNKIYQLAGFNEESSLLDFFLNQARKVTDQGYVDNLEITYLPPRQVEIVVNEKKIIGYVDYMGKYLCIDDEGYILDYTDTTDGVRPSIEGVEIENFTVYQPLDVDENIIQAIDIIYSNMVTFGVSIEKIDFAYGQGNDITLKYNDIDIEIGSTSQIEKKFQLLKEILSDLPEDSNGTLYLEDADSNIIFKKNTETEEDLVDDTEMEKTEEDTIVSSDDSADDDLGSEDNAE